MPTSDGVTHNVSYDNGHPGNTARGLQTITAFAVLADVAAAYPASAADLFGALDAPVPVP